MARTSANGCGEAAKAWGLCPQTPVHPCVVEAARNRERLTDGKIHPCAVEARATSVVLRMEPLVLLRLIDT
jgi:hypothetical protein